jgi:hypothetical protein
MDNMGLLKPQGAALSRSQGLHLSGEMAMGVGVRGCGGGGGGGLRPKYTNILLIHLIH